MNYIKVFYNGGVCLSDVFKQLGMLLKYYCFCLSMLCVVASYPYSLSKLKEVPDAVKTHINCLV